MKLTSKQKEILNSIENKNLRKEIKKEFKKIQPTMYLSKWKYMEIPSEQFTKEKLEELTNPHKLLEKHIDDVEKIIEEKVVTSFLAFAIPALEDAELTLETCQDIKNQSVKYKQYELASKFRQKEKDLLDTFSMGRLQELVGNGTIQMSDMINSLERNKRTVEKPPLGLKPKWIHDENRLTDINEAIERYNSAGVEIPKQWNEELIELKQTVKGQQIIQRVKPEGELIDVEKLSNKPKEFCVEITEENKQVLWDVWRKTYGSLKGLPSIGAFMHYPNLCCSGFSEDKKIVSTEEFSKLIGRDDLIEDKTPDNVYRLNMVQFNDTVMEFIGRGNDPTNIINQYLITVQKFYHSKTGEKIDFIMELFPQLDDKYIPKKQYTLEDMRKCFEQARMGKFPMGEFPYELANTKFLSFEQYLNSLK